MTYLATRRRVLALSASVLALAAAGPSFAQTAAAPAAPATSANQIEEVIVTAQRRSESMQNVPISVSAFSQQALQAQKIEGGPNLQLGVPNVTFSKGSRGDNFQIRGIGTNSFSVSGDASTGIHFNNTPLTDNRLFESEFLDVERVEVLRGPQGTLYGRNATGGVVNIISAKPTNKFEAMAQAQVGNYETRKLTGMVNIPIVDQKVALRIAGNYIERGGYVTNALTGGNLDGRKLGTLRVTLKVDPTENLHTNFVYSRFRENDDRLYTGKSLCVRDPGPTRVGNTAVTNPLIQGFLSQGCANASLDGAYDTPNSVTTLFGLTAVRAGLSSGDLYAGRQQIADLDTVESAKAPYYRSREDIYQFNAAWDVMHGVQLSYLGLYQKSDTENGQDGALVAASIPYNSTAINPGGIVNDPQLGPGNSLYYYNGLSRPTRQINHEVRLQTSWNSPVNISIGANTLDYKLTNTVYIESSALTGFSQFQNKNVPCPVNTATCIYIDPSSTASAIGHNYYWSVQPYRLKSDAAFGELYWQIRDNLKFTGGLRYTKDRKVADNYPVKLTTVGSGIVLGTPPAYRSEFEATTGRIGLDWKPHLDFTDSTLVYAFFTRGYKGGGPNSVGAALASIQYYQPEYVNSFEVGTKNTLLNGALVLNAAAFMYDYKNYQISKYVNRIAVTENVDAKIKGIEMDAVWQPARGLRFNMTAGLLDTQIKNGLSLDAFRRTGGDPNLTLVKNASAGACVAPTGALANLLAIIQQQPGAAVVAGVSGNPLALLNVCSGTYASLGVTPTDGVEANLAGKELPNSPHWTASIGAQYKWPIRQDWDATVRGDYYQQAEAFARPYNDAVDKIPGWSNINLSFKLQNDTRRLSAEIFVQNLTNERAVTNYLFNDDSIGLLPRAWLREPRTYGVIVAQSF